MTENEKLRMRKRDAFNGLLQRLNGTQDLTIKLALAALYLAIAIYLWAQQASVEIPALKHLMRYAIAAYLLLGGAALLLYPIGRRMARDRIQCIGLVNHAGIYRRICSASAATARIPALRFGSLITGAFRSRIGRKSVPPLRWRWG